MLGRLRELLAPPAAGAAPDPDARLRQCLAALLVETARSDFHEHPAEAAAIVELVRRQFSLTDDEAAGLVAEAREAVDGAVSLHEFTAPLHRGLTYPEKLDLIGMLWTVALRDHVLDKYEDYVVGKLAELLYVARGDVVRLRWQALQRIDPAAAAERTKDQGSAG